MLRGTSSAVRLLAAAAAAAAAAALAGAAPVLADQGSTDTGGPPTATPIKHLVVIFQENVSFDHYFGTYPHAANPTGEPRFTPTADTPTVNGLAGPLLTNNPNLSNPQRLDRTQALTCDQSHDYTAEQQAFDSGLMDKFVQATGGSKTAATCTGKETGTTPDYAVMDYYDGNTVTALWNYAQRFAMNDNSYSTTFGPSTPGAFNVTSGQSYGATCGPASAVYNSPGPCGTAPGTATPGVTQPPGTGTTYSDADPYYDKCSAGSTLGMGGPNIGDLLNAAHVTWGWFQGGFASPNYVPGQPSTDDPATVCKGHHPNIGGSQVTDYSAHHEPFQYYASTANPQHTPPSSVAMIGKPDQANHQYDLKDFWAAADAGNLPAVSFLKAAKYQDGHAGYSDPLDEQTFLVDTLNRLQRLPTWHSTAVVIAYDDSDGWYDHQMSPILMQSQTPLDALTGTGQCGSNSSRVPTTSTGAAEQARCGYGPRQPFLVISPWSRSNYVDGTVTDQASVVRFVEDNWLGGQRLGNGAADAMAGRLTGMFDFAHPDGKRLFLDPITGEPSGSSGS